MTEPTPFSRTLSLAVHEFRTPVTVVAGYLRMVLNEQAGPVTSQQRRMLEETEKSCRRLAALVMEMSDLGKMMSQELAFARQDIDVNGLVAEVASHMHEGADRGIRLEAQVSDHPMTMSGDRARLSAALGALMHAALRERGEPGTVVARCTVVQDPDSAWGIIAIGDEALLDGLAAAHRTPPAFDEWLSGVGLALPLARRIIEAHGGAVWSAVGSQWKAASALRLPLAV